MVPAIGSAVCRKEKGRAWQRLGPVGLGCAMLAAEPPWQLPSLQLDPWVASATAASAVAIFVLLLRALFRATTVQISTGIEAVLGKEGEASSELAPAGTVRVNNEEWTARAEREPIHRGEKIEVVGVDGVTLRVKKLAVVGEMSLAPQEKRHA